MSSESQQQPKGQEQNELVNWIVSQYRSLREGNQSNSAAEAWENVKREFLSSNQGGDQAWRTHSGRAFEIIVYDEFRRQLHELKPRLPVAVKRWNDLTSSEYRLVREILSEKVWPRGRLSEPYLAESNVDMIAIEENASAQGSSTAVQVERVIAAYSCKSSLRERWQQDLFWAEKLRARGIRFCLITLDLKPFRNALSQEKLRTKTEKMTTGLYDRIYLLIDDQAIKCLRRVLRPIDKLAEDLRRWYDADQP